MIGLFIISSSINAVELSRRTFLATSSAAFVSPSIAGPKFAQLPTVADDLAFRARVWTRRLEGMASHLRLSPARLARLPERLASLELGMALEFERDVRDVWDEVDDVAGYFDYARMDLVPSIATDAFHIRRPAYAGTTFYYAFLRRLARTSRAVNSQLGHAYRFRYLQRPIFRELTRQDFWERSHVLGVINEEGLHETIARREALAQHLAGFEKDFANARGVPLAQLEENVKFWLNPSGDFPWAPIPMPRRFPTLPKLVYEEFVAGMGEIHRVVAERVVSHHRSFFTDPHVRYRVARGLNRAQYESLRADVAENFPELLTESENVVTRAQNFVEDTERTAEKLALNTPTTYEDDDEDTCEDPLSLSADVSHLGAGWVERVKREGLIRAWSARP